ncbi:MAG: hypothetical protein FJ145_11475 [Deltaproteobacteria bacterium]|nr:hypothetical protein [Deltaproteobacteria bacterium]
MFFKNIFEPFSVFVEDLLFGLARSLLHRRSRRLGSFGFRRLFGWSCCFGLASLLWFLQFLSFAFSFSRGTVFEVGPAEKLLDARPIEPDQEGEQPDKERDYDKLEKAAEPGAFWLR